SGCGPLSEMLFVTREYSPLPALIINGFDRQTAGNTGDLILRHAQALSEFENAIVSATNDAMLEGLLNFPNYCLVDYMLGEESTVDETFSSSEQEMIKAYLRSGGNLFVSGSEIAWDLDNKGSSSDKAFCHNFLHLEYFQDSPGGRAGTVYSVEATGDSIFLGLGVFNFDNGSHGTYNVRYPDVFKPRGDAQTCLKYPGYSGAAGVVYQGLFPGGTTPGKIMVLGFPFETVYPEQKRVALMGSFIQLAHHGLPVEESMFPDKHQLLANYPNPFNPLTRIAYQLKTKSQLELSIYDMNGKKLAVLADNIQAAGRYDYNWNASNFASGIYLVIMKVDGQLVGSQKMTLLK
ncbi:MAG: T9SS type A sorting domain-containing protein, partial [Candidatus Neomarinimicrobiota bacterium]